LVDAPDDDFVDSLLNLEPFQELEFSTDSAKRRKMEEGDEGLSQKQP